MFRVRVSYPFSGDAMGYDLFYIGKFPRKAMGYGVWVMVANSLRTNSGVPKMYGLCMGYTWYVVRRESTVLSSRNLRWLCAAWPRLRLRNRPNAGTPLGFCRGRGRRAPQRGDTATRLARRRSSVPRWTFSQYCTCEKTGLILRECSVKCRKVV